MPTRLSLTQVFLIQMTPLADQKTTSQIIQAASGVNIRGQSTSYYLNVHTNWKHGMNTMKI